MRRTWRPIPTSVGSGTARASSPPCPRPGPTERDRLRQRGGVGRGRIEVVCATQDSAAFGLSLEALDARHEATGREVELVVDNGPCHTSQVSRAALAERATWLPKYCPQLTPKEREWRTLKRDVRSHLATSLRAFVDEILVGLRQLGGERLDIVDQVPDWFIAGHRKPPTGRPVGRPKSAKDSYQRAVPRENLAAVT